MGSMMKNKRYLVVYDQFHYDDSGFNLFEWFKTKKDLNEFLKSIKEALKEYGVVTDIKRIVEFK
jgi:Holliday junction resolvase RusA-like endonuclease